MVAIAKKYRHINEETLYVVLMAYVRIGVLAYVILSFKTCLWIFAEILVAKCFLLAMATQTVATWSAGMLWCIKPEFGAKKKIVMKK